MHVAGLEYSGTGNHDDMHQGPATATQEDFRRVGEVRLHAVAATGGVVDQHLRHGLAGIVGPGLEIELRRPVESREQGSTPDIVGAEQA